MKIGNCLSFMPLGAVLVLACMSLVGEAAAKASNYNFELTQVRSSVQASTLQRAHVIQAGADAKEYTVSSGNACQLKGVACGLSGAGCTVTCSGPGPCEFDLGQCRQGRGSSLVKVSVPYRYNPITAKIQAPRYPCPRVRPVLRVERAGGTTVCVVGVGIASTANPTNGEEVWPVNLVIEGTDRMSRFMLYVVALLAALPVPCAMAQTPEAERREYHREQDRQVEEQQRRAQEEYQRQLRGTEDPRKKTQQQYDDERRSANARPASPSYDARAAAELQALRVKLLGMPPLPDERNTLLGRWRVESDGKPKRKDELGQAMAMLANPAAPPASLRSGKASSNSSRKPGPASMGTAMTRSARASRRRQAVVRAAS